MSLGDVEKLEILGSADQPINRTVSRDKSQIEAQSDGGFGINAEDRSFMHILVTVRLNEFPLTSHE